MLLSRFLCLIGGFCNRIFQVNLSSYLEKKVKTNDVPIFSTFINHCQYVMMTASKRTVMEIKTYQGQAELLVRDFLLAQPYIPYTSVLGGIFACKLAYDLTQVVSSLYFRSFVALTKLQFIEWNNRGISTLHAIFITIMSLYLAIFADLFSEHGRPAGLIVFRSSPLSTFALGVSVGYFLVDLGLLIWFYPSLGGIEYVLHHLVSLVAVAYSMSSGEGQFYTYMVLISEATTPAINLRWYLCTAGMKDSMAYLINGVAIFFAWLGARILLFIYLFYHIYLHYDQVNQMQPFARLMVFGVPLMLFIMNSFWFAKIVRGLKKTLAKTQ